MEFDATGVLARCAVCDRPAGWSYTPVEVREVYPDPLCRDHAPVLVRRDTLAGVVALLRAFRAGEVAHVARLSEHARGGVLGPVDSRLPEIDRILRELTQEVG